MFKIVNGMTPRYLKDIFSATLGASVYNLRTSQDIAILRSRPYGLLPEKFRIYGMHSLMI